MSYYSGVLQTYIKEEKHQVSNWPTGVHLQLADLGDKDCPGGPSQEANHVPIQAFSLGPSFHHPQEQFEPLHIGDHLLHCNCCPITIEAGKEVSIYKKNFLLLPAQAPRVQFLCGKLGEKQIVHGDEIEVGEAGGS